MKVVEIGQRNIAPSADDPEHDIHVCPIAIGSATLFWLEHSIRSGHAERGGCSMLALHELEGWRGHWRADATRAGCAWAIPLWNRPCAAAMRRPRSRRSLCGWTPRPELSQRACGMHSDARSVRCMAPSRVETVNR